MSVNRRIFLRRAAGVASAAAFTGKPAFVATQTASLPTPDNSGIEHIVVVMMENRSFDHLLGWLPGANRQQTGLAYLDNKGEGSDRGQTLPGLLVNRAALIQNVYS